MKKSNLYVTDMAQTIKSLSAVQETRVRFLGCEDHLEKEMAPHSSTLTWKIPWMEGPGRLQSMGSQRVGHDDGREVMLTVTSHAGNNYTSCEL